MTMLEQVEQCGQYDVARLLWLLEFNKPVMGSMRLGTE